jgi:GT2 family glycosyltransferase
MIQRPRGLPQISFVVPVRDDAVRLRACLASIAALDYPTDLVDTIVVLDRRSDDESANVARGAGARLLTGGGSVADLRNRGARAALGAILAFVDADHVIDRGWARAAVRAIAGLRVAAAGADYETPPHPTWVQRQYGAMRRTPRVATDVLWLGAGNLAVRRSVFLRVGGFDTALETCEDVDLCQRILAERFRIVADPAMRSTHFGDPATLRALFFGELWRGRSNLRVTLRGPRSFTHMRSALIPLLTLVIWAAAIAALPFRPVTAIAAACSGVLLFGAIRASRMLFRHKTPTAVLVAQALTVALVYDLARALALVFPATHRARRVSEFNDAIANSRS